VHPKRRVGDGGKKRFGFIERARGEGPNAEPKGDKIRAVFGREQSPSGAMG